MLSLRSNSIKALFAVAALFTAKGLYAETPEELVKKGEVFDEKFQAAQALALYQQAEKLKPNDADIHCRIARQYRHLMADASGKDEKLRLGHLAVQHGQKAAQLAPNSSEAQMSPAISYGKMIALQSKKEQVKASLFIRSTCEKAIKLDPNNDNAWHILGRWHRNVTEMGSTKRALASFLYDELPAASNADAVNCLQKAIAINPSRAMHYIELGRVYAQMEKPAEARKFIEKGLAMPNHDKDDSELKAVGRAVLAGL